MTDFDSPMVPVTGLNKRELADATGLTLKRIDALVREGMPSTPGASKREGLRFDLPEVFMWYAERGQGDTTVDAKRRLAIAQAAKIEAQNRRADGELVPVADVRAEIQSNMARLRDSLLAVPARLTNQPIDVQAEVRAEIVAAINALSFEHGSATDV